MAEPDNPGGKPAPLRPRPTEYEVVHRERVLDMFFKVDQVTVKHQRFDGTMSEPRPWLVFERGDAAAALLFNPDTREVILIDQFRVPTLGKTAHRGWLYETVAGMIPDGADPSRQVETPEQCIIREIEEEVGYRVTDLVPIANFFSSPGGTSERIHLFYAEVNDTKKVSEGGGVDEGENIQEVRMPLGELMRKLAAREFEDPKIIIAGQWLRERRTAQERDTGVLSPPTWYSVPKSPGKRIAFLTGDIADVKGLAQVWVNPENTDMLMDRFFDRSVSATIRFLGAEKYANTKRVKEDHIADALAERMRGRKFVRPATVLDTTSGELADSHGVERIYHVAAVEGVHGDGQRTDISTLEACVDEVLREVAKAKRYKSILFPMMGTGKGGFTVRSVAPIIIGRALAFLEANPASPIERILILGYTMWDGDVLAEALEKLVGEKRLERL